MTNAHAFGMITSCIYPCSTLFARAVSNMSLPFFVLINKYIIRNKKTLQKEGPYNLYFILIKSLADLPRPLGEVQKIP